LFFLQVNAERPVLNGPDGDKLQEEIKVISKPEPEDEVDDIPSHPPPQPPSRPPIPKQIYENMHYKFMYQT
jgi:hypothetical protein